MSVQRTPPKEISGSAPNLYNVHYGVDEGALNNITLRQEKRKRGDVLEEEMKSFMVEMRKMLTLATDAQNQKFTLLHSVIEDIKKQNAEITKALDFMSMKYEEYKLKMDKNEEERKTQISYIKALETRVEQLERNARQSCIEIRNVPRNTSENKEHLINILKNIGTAIKSDILDSDIKDIFRYNAKSSPKLPITVEFTSVVRKEAFLESMRQYKRINKTVLSTSQAKVDDRIEPIYISESLTPQNKKIYAMARKFSMENSYKFCWTTHGNIYLRKEEGSKAVRVFNEEDLNKLASNM